MKIETGKRYIRRDGSVSGVLYEAPHSSQGSIFMAEQIGESYWGDGQSTTRSDWDLISEYTPISEVE